VSADCELGANGALVIGICQVVLPVAAEEIPVARVVWPKLDGSLIPFRGVQVGIVLGKSIVDAGVRESGGERQRKKDKKPARRWT
jgi:hypothetical protein